MSGGSGYSRFGIGDVRYFPSARALGMGGVSLAITGGDGINRLNPASRTSLKLTRFSGSYIYEGFSTTDGVSSAYLSSGIFGGTTLSIPIKPSRGIVFAGGFNPYSNVNYDINTQESQLGTNYDVRYTGSGGLSTALLGLSYAPSTKLHLGIQTEYLFGTIENSWEVDFASTSFLSSRTQRMTQYRGFQFTFGIIHSGIGSLIGLSDGDQLSVGALVTTPVDLTVERETSFSPALQADTTALQKGTVHIPARFGLGAALTIDNRYLIGTDFSYQNWNDYEEFGIHPKELRNSVRWSIGAERLPKRQPLSFGDRVAYRIGFAYNVAYYRVKNTAIDEISFSGGIGFPVGAGTRINAAAEYAFRGTTDNQLQKDNILRFIVTINIGELWFVRRTEE
ncbi:MAG: hypothetical protein V3U10_01400 [Bacteroidota bacterium]